MQVAADGKQASADFTANSTPLQGVGRGRGRGRGRGAARGANTRANSAALPTARERAAQLRGDGDQQAPERKSGSGTSLEDLGKALNEAFPSSLSPVDPFAKIPISTLGYQELAMFSYRELLSIDRHAEEDLSEAEFMLVAGYAFAKRVLDVQAEYLLPSIDVSEFLDSVPKNFPVPAPLATALHSLGTFKFESGTTGMPTFYLPNGADDHSAGFAPTGVLHEADAASTSYFQSYYPFGWYKGKLIDTVERLNRMDDDGKEKKAKRDYLSKDLKDVGNYAGCFSFLNYLREASKRREGMLASIVASIPKGTGIKARLCVSGLLFADYLRFASRFDGKYSFVALQSDNRGSKVLAGFATPLDGDKDTPPTSFEVRSNIQLDQNEQQAVRLFRWRLQMVREDNVVSGKKGDLKWLTDKGPSLLRPPGAYRITSVDSSAALCQLFVSFYRGKGQRS